MCAYFKAWILIFLDQETLTINFGTSVLGHVRDEFRPTAFSTFKTRIYVNVT